MIISSGGTRDNKIWTTRFSFISSASRIYKLQNIKLIDHELVLDRVLQFSFIIYKGFYTLES